MTLEILDAGECACGHGGGKSVGEELWPGALSEIVAKCRRPRDESSGGATQRLAQGRGDDVDLTQHAEMLCRSSPFRSQYPSRMRVIYHQHRLVLAAELDEVGKLGDGPLHGENAIGNDQLDSPVARSRQLGVQIGQVTVQVDGALAL